MERLLLRPSHRRDPRMLGSQHRRPARWGDRGLPRHHRSRRRDQRHRALHSGRAPASGAHTPPGRLGGGPAPPGAPPVPAAVTTAPAPPPPPAPAVSAGAGQATVTWVAPADGNASLSGYTVTPYIGATAQTAS